MDKDYSRTAARTAISQLFEKINILREPPQGEQRFRPQIVFDQAATTSAFLGTVEAGNEGSLEQHFERIILLIVMENGG